ncbi:hypothetical protein [Streptomyces fulvoviolaceus]|uniref:hypothetical protein n=1 Tax=Streptomyces fulvoviolaceus TaxID=285535 RepID=UPI00131BD434|nr:hypothetical protein [Streptomyces fulvoviolaceus]
MPNSARGRPMTVVGPGGWILPATIFFVFVAGTLIASNLDYDVPFIPGTLLPGGGPPTAPERP